ncbi:MAG: glucose-6-phosphate isomerase [Bacteroidota bacterium]|nr:glucose-6-phosphate isomerase [Bacteroidota bacterium]
MLKYNYTGMLDYISENELMKTAAKMQKENQKLHAGGFPGQEFLGWVNLPGKLRHAIPEDWKNTISQFSDKEVIVCVGIGGSYLGAKAVHHALKIPFSKAGPEILFAGHHLGHAYHDHLLKYLSNKDFAVVVISKSGTTTEPAIAFRMLLKLLRSKMPESELKNNIIAITDKSKGALRELAGDLNLPRFVVPDDIGGRFSVFTAVGLIPLMLAGIDSDALICGAADMAEQCDARQIVDKNPAIQYAAVRQMMWKSDKHVEILANSEPPLTYVAEWWKQLFGESEGKDGLGILPASINLTTDLHSLGQFIQDGNPMFFETFIQVVETNQSLKIERQESNLDSLNYLTGKSIDYVNKQATAGTIEAHRDGRVPLSQIMLQRMDAYHIGQLLYFFEKSCGISAYALGVNPFNQPGVEAYKANMFRLLGKPKQ